MRASTWKLTGFALAPYLALPFAAARAGDVVVPEDAVVAAAAKAEQSTVVLRITRGAWNSTGTALLDASKVALERARAAAKVPPREAKPEDSTPPADRVWVRFGQPETRAQLMWSASGQGTTQARGVFVGDGHAILTASVAVDGATKVEVLRDGGAVEAVVAGLDRDFDVAVLRTSAAGPALEIDAGSELEPGRVVILSGASETGGIEVRYVSARGGVSPRRG